MLFSHLKRILKLDRLRLRGPVGAGDEFHLAATAQNLRRLAKQIPSRREIQARDHSARRKKLKQQSLFHQKPLKAAVRCNANGLAMEFRD